MSLALKAAHCCRLCDIADGRSDRAVDMPWLNAAKHFAFTSVGALVPGWSLIAPRRHVMNMANEYSQASFWEFVKRAASLVEAAYGSCVAFEHGSVETDSLTGCGTGHAHLHLVPLGFELAEKASSFDATLTWREVQASDIAVVAAGSEYLFVADRLAGDRTTGLLAILEVGQSQYFRRVIAAHLGRPDEYDYKVYPQLDVAEDSARRLASAAKDSLAAAA